MKYLIPKTIETITINPIHPNKVDVPALGNSLGNSSWTLGSVSFIFGLISEDFVLALLEESVYVKSNLLFVFKTLSTIFSS